MVVDLKAAKTAVGRIALPNWAHGWSLSEDLDGEGEPLLRVWLEVDRELDVKVVYDELDELTDRIRAAIREAGITEWVQVTLTNPVTG